MEIGWGLGKGSPWKGDGRANEVVKGTDIVVGINSLRLPERPAWLYFVGSGRALDGLLVNLKSWNSTNSLHWNINLCPSISQVWH